LYREHDSPIPNDGAAHKETVESCMHLISFLKTRKNMKNVVGVHVLDLNWFKNGKNNWKFRAYRTLQKVKKGIISVGRQAHTHI
jgi:hypothetical protein